MSPHSASVRKYGNLKHEKGRIKHSQFLVEGIKLIREIISISPDIIEKILISQKVTDPALASLVRKEKVRMQYVPEADIAYLSDTQNNQGVVAVARFSSLKPDWASCRYVSLLDGIQDPGNVGAIIRTSFAFGMDSVILGKGTCDIYNPKVVRSSAGMFLRMPFEVNVDLLSKIRFLRQKGFTVLATSPYAQQVASQVKLRKKVALIVSNEGSGINTELASSADSIIRVPLKNTADSLNVAVAHGIICHNLIWGRE
jgi:TrmH family RNA methyltransferase